ncbi:capsid protein [Haloarcula sinaiiensis tailed virus 1]|uniref:Capsid protein n=1 Tax=Haloarcula sinaiiensis tailed virus 1 TaxID=1262530 RepID=R9QT65_9CAUD|nr:major head protein [Haloarcula sinaiiensis tailed virus 1]AGC34559.1 capsid protein [Haloarcula sinaiiensis tailed virus 1]
MSIGPVTRDGAVKNRQEIKKNKDTLYRRSFGDLPDGTIYRDPCGWKSGDGEAIELQKDRFDQLAREPVAELSHMVKSGESPTVLNAWNSWQEKGFGLAETTKEIRKNLDTGDWTLPLDIIPQIFVVNPEQLPLADMMTRVTTQDDEVVPTPLTDHPSISSGLETTDDTEGSYAYSDPTYDDTVSFDVIGYGAATRLEDKLILASSNLRNAESSQEQAFMRAMRQYEERQIILGQANNDATGFVGFDDLIANQDGEVIGDLGDPADQNPEDFEQATRDIIDAAEFDGAARESLAVVCDYDWHKEVRKSLVSQQRYDGNVEEIGAGFSTLTLDNVPLMKTNAIPRAIQDRADGSTYNQVYTVNMEAHYLSMLQEPQIKPLAKVAPQEQFAVDAYGCLTAEDNGEHVKAYTVSPVA